MLVLAFALGETSTLVSIVTMSIYTPIRHHPPIVYSQGITVLTQEFWDKPLNSSQTFPQNVTRASVWEEEGEARACSYVEELDPCNGCLAHLWLSLVSSWSPKWQIICVPPRLMYSYLPDLPVAEFPGQAAPDASMQTDSSSLMSGSF